MSKRHSGFVRTPYPNLSDAFIVSAVFGHAVICRHNNLYHLVWWEGDERFSQVLMWEDCSSCGEAFNAILDTCPECLMLEEKVA